LEAHAKSTFPVKGSNNFGIPAMLLEKVLDAAKINATPAPDTNLTRKAFISKFANNIVLIEAR
jgi:hypothetical protein